MQKKSISPLRAERLKAIKSRRQMQYRVKFTKKTQHWKNAEVDYIGLQEASKGVVVYDTEQKRGRDPDAILTIMKRNGIEQPYKPTQKQLKAEYYRSQGMSKAKAMRHAGYSAVSAKQGTAFTPRMVEYTGMKMQNALREQGINEELAAKKMKQWLEAKKTHVTKNGDVIESDDTMAQIKAYEKVNEILKFSDTSKQGVGNHQKLTIESWTFDESVPGEEVHSS